MVYHMILKYLLYFSNKVISKFLSAIFPLLFSINCPPALNSLSTGADDGIAVLNLMYAFFNSKGKLLGVFNSVFDR